MKPLTMTQAIEVARDMEAGKPVGPQTTKLMGSFFLECVKMWKQLADKIPDIEATPEPEEETDEDAEEDFSGHVDMTGLAFYYLQQALDKLPIPRESGGTELANAGGEFMLMTQTETEWHFKHIITRNYLMLDKKTDEIRIPTTDQPFLKGVF